MTPAQTQQQHTRVICASLTRVDGSVMDELLGIREQVCAFNRAHGLRAAFLHASGWFFQWLEGPAAAIDKALRVSQADSRHGSLRVIHRSLGKPFLNQLLEIAAVHGGEKPTDVARRIHRLERDQSAGPSAEPQELWLELAAPLRLAPADACPSALVRRHVVAVTSEYTESVDLIRTLAERFSSPVTYQRFASGTPKSADVGAAYVDLPGSGHVTRLQALSRRSLSHPLVEYSLRQLNSMVLLLGARAEPSQALLEEVAVLLESLAVRPALRLAAADPATARLATEHLRRFSDDIAAVDHAGLRRAGPDVLFDMVLGSAGRSSEFDLAPG